MASSSWATTCLVHPMSYKATLKLSPQKKDLLFIKKIFAEKQHLSGRDRLPNRWNLKMTLKYSISAHLCIARSRSQEPDKQAVAKLKQDYMDITGYLHYARAREVGWQAVGKPEPDRIGLESWPRFSWTSTGH